LLALLLAFFNIHIVGDQVISITLHKHLFD